MKKIIFTAIITIVSQYIFAQIPFEVMVGNKQTQYFAYLNKDIDSIGRWNIFSQSNFAINYEDNTLNSISIDGQLTYMLNNWLGVSAGAAFDGIKLNPLIGFSISYINKKQDFVITTFPTINLSKPVSLDLFAIINYSPVFSKKWGIFTQFIIGSNLGIEKENSMQKRELFYLFTKHNLSTQFIRIGLNYKQKFQFGLGADLFQIGMGEGSFQNFGIFLRYEII